MIHELELNSHQGRLFDPSFPHYQSWIFRNDSQALIVVRTVMFPETIGSIMHLRTIVIANRRIRCGILKSPVIRFIHN